MPLQIQPVEWRVGQKDKSPNPHQSSIFDPGSAARRKEQWGDYHEDTNSTKSFFKT
jgi:hypothetical protein